MFRFQRDGCVKIFVPRIHTFAGESVHKVDADIMETGIPASAESLYGLLCVVASFQKRQDIIVEGLYSHTQTVERKGREHFHIFVCQVIRVRFYCDFSIRIYAVIVIYGSEYICEIVLFKLRWCSATKVNCVYCFTAKVVFSSGYFLAQYLYVFVFLFR